MHPETLMLYKLIILYVLNKAGSPLSNSQLTNFILENDYTDYFRIQQTLGELISDGCVGKQTIRNTTLYVITDLGSETLDMFHSSLSQSIREDADRYIAEHGYELREEISALGDYYREKDGVYKVRLQITERGSIIFELGLALTSAQEADQVCSQWREKSTELYDHIFKVLLGG